MQYVSTRGLPGQSTRSFCDILLEGLAPDGGLYVPLAYPRVDGPTLSRWRALLEEQGYAALAHAVLTPYVDDIPSEDLLAMCRRAYTAEKFGDPQIVPVSRLSDGLWLGHLSNGPSAAFKDMAMQLLGELFEYQLQRTGRELNILGATSGDTGSSAEYAMLGKRGIRVFMMTPKGRMTPFQQAQMFTIDDPAIVNLAVDGVFDDCQDLVKAVSSDLEFKARRSIGAVNSINWARVVAQVVYYVACWLRVSAAVSSEDPDAQRVSFSVPTGNFGDILAGHVARTMGVPIGDLILATNENDVLDEFFRTGVYRVRGAVETYATSSPSMDISKASNFERFVFDLLGRDGARVAELFGTRLTTQGAFDLSADPAFAGARSTYGFCSGRSTHGDRVATIAAVHAADQVTIDPHTADAVTVARAKLACGEVEAPVVAMETALPVKFAATIQEALGRDPECPPRFAGLERLPRHVIDIDNDADKVKIFLDERLG
ncbi:MAG: threonine synthase [Austwickia sp.]|nr:threonine synthase [Austwickia sp.]MBK8436605.1 threonine synthase [Austwickia sp.]MBK9102270.1 threonine synthase [Austwickia sp.]